MNSHAAGGAPDFADIINAQTEVAKDNGAIGRLGWATTPGMAGKLVASAAGADMIWTGTFEDDRLGGYPAMASNQLSSALGGGTNEHGMIFGNWADLLIGLWGGFEVITDPFDRPIGRQGL